MNESQYGKMFSQNEGNPLRNRSTRSPKPSPDPSSGMGSGGAKSRLADGARSRPGSSGSHPPNTPQKPMGAKGGSPQAKSEKSSASGQPGSRSKLPASKDRRSPEAQGQSGRENQPDKGKKNDQENTGPKTDQNNENAQSDTSGEKGGGEKSSGASGAVKDLGKKAKDASANATKVDYSDKGLKDQLEHQAADMAMDATPGLSQFNSARRALKDFNKAKKSVGGKDDDVSDKAEKAMDDGVDKGIKGAKFVAGAGVASGVGNLGLIGLAVMKMLMALKGAILAVAGKIAGFFSSIFSGMSSFVTGLLGVSAAVSHTIVAGFLSTMLVGTSVFGFGVTQELTKKDDAMAMCTPEKTAVPKASQEYIGDGEMEAVREDNAVKLWSVYSELGGSKEQTAAVLGNLQAESSLDPTSIETIYDEPFSIGSRKQAAISNDFKVDLIDSSYGARFPAIDYVGIGLAQWTNGRNRLLVDYADEQDVNWYDFDTQIRFMLDGDDPGRQDQLTDFLGAEPGNVQSEAERFMNTWIGLSSPNPSLSDRQTNATDYMFILERATADTDYADSILSGINVNRSSGNSAAGAYHQDDGCGNPIKSHYGNQSVDGTGEVPADLTLVPWSRETLPESLSEFAKNPEDAGLAWGNSSGWTNGIFPDQCAALSHSYFIKLYPDWNKDGRPTTRPFGDGKDVARLWAEHYGEHEGDVPAAGAVFSDTTTSQFGHTGIVQHVFANGDILINEQNIRGVSGAGAGLNYSWSWRVIKKERYEQADWKFFKPSTAEPQWVTRSNA